MNALIDFLLFLFTNDQCSRCQHYFPRKQMVPTKDGWYCGCAPLTEASNE